jgi:hypothetical protein
MRTLHLFFVYTLFLIAVHIGWSSLAHAQITDFKPLHKNTIYLYSHTNSNKGWYTVRQGIGAFKRYDYSENTTGYFFHKVLGDTNLQGVSYPCSIVYQSPKYIDTQKSHNVPSQTIFEFTTQDAIYQYNTTQRVLTPLFNAQTPYYAPFATYQGQIGFGVNSDSNKNRIAFSYSREQRTMETRSNSYEQVTFERGKGIVQMYKNSNGSSQYLRGEASEGSSNEEIKLVAIMSNGRIIGDSIIQYLDTERNVFHRIRQIINHTKGAIHDTVDVQIELRGLKPLTKDSSISVQTVLSFNSAMLEPLDSGFRGVQIGSIRRVPINLRISKGFDSLSVSIPCKVLSGRDTKVIITADLLRFASGQKILQDIHNGSFQLIFPKFLISVPSLISSRLGEAISIPIHFNFSSTASHTIGQVNTALQMNASLLEPIENTPRGSVTQGVRSIPISLNFQGSIKDTTITHFLKFRSVLGNDSASVLTLDTPRVQYNQFFEYDIQNGMLKVEGMNHAGGPIRFISRANNVSVFPNPFVNEINIPTFLKKSATIEVALYALQGIYLAGATFFNVSSDESAIRWRIPSQIPDGMYMIVLKEDGKQRETYLIRKGE